MAKSRPRKNQSERSDLPCHITRYVHKGKTSTYHELLQRIGLGTTLENRRIQERLITINACFQGTAPTCIEELVKMRNNKYDLRGNNTLSLPKVNTTKHGLNSFRYYAAKQWNSIPNELRLKAGGLEFNNNNLCISSAHLNITMIRCAFLRCKKKS